MLQIITVCLVFSNIIINAKIHDNKRELHMYLVLFTSITFMKMKFMLIRLPKPNLNTPFLN